MLGVRSPRPPAGLVMKAVHCRDLGFDCDGVVRASTDEAVLQGVAEHAREAHDVEVTPEIAEQARAAIREEPAEPP